MSSPTSRELRSVASPRSAQRRLVWAAQLAFVPTGILTTLLGPMLPILIPRWALNDAQAGNLFLAQFLACLAGVQLSGVLLARHGFRPPFLLGLILMAAGVASIGGGSLWVGLTAISAYGLGIGFMNPTDNLLIAEISAREGAGAISLLNFFWGVGAITCALSVAWADAHKVLSPLLVSVALLLVALALAVRGLPFPGQIRTDQSPISWRVIWRMPATWFFAAVFFLYPGAETAVGGWISSYVVRQGLHPQMGPFMPGFFWTGLTLGRFAGGGLLNRMPERRVLIGGFAFATAGIALMIWAHSLAQVIASALITGLSFSTLYPITIARLSRRFGAATRSLGSVMFSMASIGPAVVPWAVGLASNAAGNLRVGLLVPLAATAVLLLIHLREW